MADKDLAGRKAIVTGSATGLGRSIALRLAERGADVIINCTRSIADGEATVAACNEVGAQAQLVAADVSTDEGARKLADAASAWGRLDILVNNAGITRHARDHSDLDALSREDFLDTYAVNVAGPFLVMQACKPLMVKAFEQTGRASTVLNISSIAGVTGIGSSVAYAATKGALNTMTLSLARALAPHPKVLLLDEPLSALDYKLRKEMQIELKRLQNETGITFVFVTHDQEEALTMSDRIAVMQSGNVLQLGSPREIYDRPAERFVADFIGDTNFLDVEVVSVKAAAVTLKLTSGTTVETDAPHSGANVTAGRRVTAALRPEHATVTADTASADIAGTMTNVVYFGTDTHYHIALDGGKPFVARSQNVRGGTADFSVGDTVGIKLQPRALQVLKD